MYFRFLHYIETEKNLKPTLNDNLCLKTIYRTLMLNYRNVWIGNRKCSNENRKIEIWTIEAEIRIEATQITRRIVTALTPIQAKLIELDL